MAEPPAVSPDGLTIADEVLLLHCSTKAWGSIDPNVAAGVFADLALTGRIGIREMSASWWQHASSLNRGTNRFRIFVDNPTPLADPVLDAALDQLAVNKPAAGPKWCIQHIRPWKEILTRLVKSGILIPDRDSTTGRSSGRTT